MRLACTGLHPGTLPVFWFLFQVEPAEFVVSAVKQSEDGGGWLVRGYNITGENSSDAQTLEAVQESGASQPGRRKIDSLKPDKEGVVTLPVRGHEIVTIHFQELTKSGRPVQVALITNVSGPLQGIQIPDGCNQPMLKITTHTASTAYE